MKTIKAFIIRLLIVVIPLVALYFYAQMAFEENSQREHRTDAGLGIAFLLIFILLVLLVGFIYDFVKQLRTKNYKEAYTDIPFLLAFMLPLLYLGCQMSSRDCFCTWIISIGP